MRKKNAHSGYTLTEILIAIVLLGILAGLAVPTYFTTIEQSRSNEAKSNLYTIWMAEKIYKLNNNVYYPFDTSTSTLTSINSALNIEVATQYYTLTVGANKLSGAGAACSATAARGNTGAKTFTISFTGADTTPPSITESGNYN